jgi:hypothetical protein
LSFSSEEEKAQRKEKREAEAREADRRKAERRLEVVEQRALAEQHGALCEVELVVTKSADSSLGASFIGTLEAMCDRRVGGAEPAKAIAQCRECGRKEKGKFAKCAGRRRGISCVTTVV